MTFIEKVVSLQNHFFSGAIFPILCYFAGTFIQECRAKGEWFDWNILSQYRTLFIIILLLYGLEIIIRKKINHNILLNKLLYNQLEVFYKTIGFEKDINKDFRCTIWIPEIHENKMPFKLKQIVDYYPPRSAVIEDDKIKGYIENEKAGRVFDAVKKENNTYIPIGGIGLCAFETLQKCKSLINIWSMPKDEDFTNYHITNFNFDQDRIKKLNQNRRSYLCISMFDITRKSLLGILYCDAAIEEAFTKEIADNIEMFIPCFSQILVL